MDLKEYFKDLRTNQRKLEKKYPNGVVHVTSLFYRERNSTPGATASATCENAARVITDGTHREATEEEIKAFYDHQRRQLEQNVRSEQMKKQQYVIVTDKSDPFSNATVVPAQRGRSDEEAVALQAAKPDVDAEDEN